jgi:hypothetical protein
LLASAIIYGLDGYAPSIVLGAPLLTWLTAGLGIYLLLLSWPKDQDRH